MPLHTTDVPPSKVPVDWRLGLVGEGVPALTLERPDFRAEIALAGAHLTTFDNTALGRSMFWRGSSPVVAGHAYRGGVPLVFPWFAGHRERGDFPSHGFARNMLWSFAGEFREGDAFGVALELTENPMTRLVWPHAFRARLETVVSALAVEQRLTIKNTSDAPCTFEGGFHPYFSVGDLREVHIEGLDGVTFIDKTAPGLPRKVQQGALRFDRPVDYVYVGTTSACRIIEPGRPAIRLEKSGSNETTVWNPGSKDPVKWPPSPYVCVEPMNCHDHPVALGAGESHVLRAWYSWEE